jgi:hypothetical protein
MEHSRSESNENEVSYFDDAYVKFGMLLQEQGYSRRQKSWRLEFWIQGAEFLEWNTQRQSEPWHSLAQTYRYLGKYSEAEKLELQVLDARQNAWSGAPRHNQSHGTSSS